MKLRCGLSEKTVEQISGVLARFRGVEGALLFGSRAKGTYRHGSDIDLALVGASLDWRTVGKIYDALDDLLELLIFGQRVMIGARVAGLVTLPEESIDIDTPLDLALAELLLARRVAPTATVTLP